MVVLGIESSCDECSVALVRDGRQILSNIVATQVERHAPWNGVVPEIASRLHVEWIEEVTARALHSAGIESVTEGVDAIAVAYRPGLIGSLLVGLAYAKGLAWSAGKPWVGVDHVMAHLYSPQLEHTIEYPCLGLIVSGGHTLICRMDSLEDVAVLGATIDDACGEAFDKVAKHYQMGYPGGMHLDELAENGDPKAFRFPKSRLYKGHHPYDVSYSGLKTAAVNQLEQFRAPGARVTVENIAASFRMAAIDMLLGRLRRASQDTGIRRVLLGGGVSANRYLRRSLMADQSLEAFFPSMALCMDNGAMIAGLGYHQLVRGERSMLNLNAMARVPGYRQLYPGLASSPSASGRAHS